VSVCLYIATVNDGIDVQVESIVFDKTGTLTHGVPRVSHVVLFVPQSDMSLQTILAIAGSAETSSEHPIGTAIVTYVKKVRFSFLCFFLLYSADRRYIFYSN